MVSNYLIKFSFVLACMKNSLLTFLVPRKYSFKKILRTNFNDLVYMVNSVLFSKLFTDDKFNKWITCENGIRKNIFFIGN